MKAYSPGEVGVALGVAGALAALLLVGLAVRAAIPVRAGRVFAWGACAAGVVFVEVWTAEAGPGFRMLAICGAVLYGMKAVVTAQSRAVGERVPGPWAWLAFAVGWFGMRPSVFAGERAPDARWMPAVRRGVAHLAAGLALVLAARWTAHRLGPWAATPLLLVGLSLALHFGVFGLLAALWRRVGYPCRPLFRAPAEARTLAEFWGRRWNLAFSEMTSLAVFRPLSGSHGRSRTGRSRATLAAFAFSGVLHELAISVPVRACFGLPLLYFLLHGGLVLVERSGVGGGRAWTAAWLLLPAPLLFHPPFLRGVLWPLLG